MEVKIKAISEYSNLLNVDECCLVHSLEDLNQL